jgi:hypothetical protein
MPRFDHSLWLLGEVPGFLRQSTRPDRQVVRFPSYSMRFLECYYKETASSEMFNSLLQKIRAEILHNSSVDQNCPVFLTLIWSLRNNAECTIPRFVEGLTKDIMPAAHVAPGTIRQHLSEFLSTQVISIGLLQAVQSVAPLLFEIFSAAKRIRIAPIDDLVSVIKIIQETAI